MDLSSRSSRSTFTRDSDQPPQRDEVNMDSAVVDDAAREREEYRAGLARRVAAYEQCVEAVGVLTASLEELSVKIEAMKTSTQQLNAFTSGWLTVWQRA